MNRTQNTQLPGASELEAIMAKEAFRAVPASKQDVHYPDFNSAIQLLTHFDLPTDMLLKDFSIADVNNMLDLPTPIIQQLADKLIVTAPSHKTLLLLNAVYDYLAEEDKLASADYIFVYGAKTMARIEKAVELYKAGYAPKMIISGGNPIYVQDNEMSEAGKYQAYALENGVPDDAIILEDKSITIPDNVRTSLNLLDEKGLPYSSFILVNSPYVQRRGWVLFKKYCEDNVKLTRVNCGTLEKFQRDQWYKNEDAIKVVIGEFFKMKIAVTLNTG